MTRRRSWPGLTWEKAAFYLCYTAAAGAAVLAWVLSGKDLVWGAQLLLLGLVLGVLLSNMKVKGRRISVEWTFSRVAWSFALASIIARHWLTPVALLTVIVSDAIFWRRRQDGTTRFPLSR